MGWIVAVELELKRLRQFDAFEVVKIPVNYQVVSSRFVVINNYSGKTNSQWYESRLVINGYEFKTSFGEDFAPKPQLHTFRLVAAYCVSIALKEFRLHSNGYFYAFRNEVSIPMSILHRLT